jgi:hypothetical protein
MSSASLLNVIDHLREPFRTTGNIIGTMDKKYKEKRMGHCLVKS